MADNCPDCNALRERITALADLGVREGWPPDEFRAGLRALLDASPDREGGAS